MRNKNESQILCKMRKLAQNIYFEPYFVLAGYISRQYNLHLRAFTVSRKTNDRFSDESHFDQKN